MNENRMYKWGALLLISIFIFRPLAAQEKNRVEDYIHKYKELAMDEMVRTGVPAAISLAQGIIESGAGTTWLSLHANNQFGIKCKSTWQGESVSYTDDRRNECFRKYATIEDSWRDHSNFLKRNQRYRFLFYLDPLDYKAWAYGLKEAGYATSGRYAKQIIQTIQNYKLERFSRQGLARAKENQPEDEFAAVLNKKIQQENPRESASANQNHLTLAEQREAFPRKVFKINKREVIFLPEGTQLISIAEVHDIPLRRLVRFNELSSDVLPKGMLIFLEKKRKKGDHPFHEVRNGESLHQIAQEEGIQLKWLLKRNHLASNSAIQPGETLALKGYNTGSAESKTQEKSGFFGWLSKLFSGSHEEMEKQMAQQPPEPHEELPPQAVKTKTNAPLVYNVKPGDTLYGIARKYNVTIDQIREKNNLKGNIIKVGQNLLIPQE